MHDLGSILGRWHQWRRAWTHERKYARVALLHAATEADADDELEDRTMRIVEEVVDGLSQDLRLAIQHVARAECLGVEVIHNPRLGEKANRERLVAMALRDVEKGLRNAGVLG